MSEQDLAKKVEEYQKLGKENPNVDVSLLMMNALAQEDAGKTKPKSYRWPYLVSIGLPPFGLIYVVIYYLSDDERDKTAAKFCLLLTVLSLIIFVVSFKALLSGSGTSVEQIQQIKPSDVMELTR